MIQIIFLQLKNWMYLFLHISNGGQSVVNLFRRVFSFLRFYKASIHRTKVDITKESMFIDTITQ